MEVHSSLPKLSTVLTLENNKIMKRFFVKIPLAGFALLHVSLAGAQIDAGKFVADTVADVPPSVSLLSMIPDRECLDAAVLSIDSAYSAKVISFLADDALEGREAGTRGGARAAEFIVSELSKYGIGPCGSDYFRYFEAIRLNGVSRAVYMVKGRDDRSVPEKGRIGDTLKLRNVLAMIEGVRKDEFVIVGAHYDHLGTDPDLEGDNIYNGADDNASGVSAVLQIARAFSMMEKPERTVIFAFWDGEEKGLLGSKFFVENVRSGLDSLIADISMVKGYMNFDMIGGNNKPDVPEHFVYFYTASEKRYEDWMTGGIERYSLELAPDIRAWDYPAGGSDNTYFAKYGVPVIWYHTDAHPYYHRPSDHADKVNMSKVVDISRLSFMTFYCMANENL